jgi:hypothetical protein
MLAEVDLTLRDVAGDQDDFPWPFAVVPVLLNGHGPFPFGVEIGRGRTMLTEEVVRTIGIDPAEIPDKLTLKGEGCSLDFPLLKLTSLAIGSAVLSEFDAMVWANPKINREPEQQRKKEVPEPVASVRCVSEAETTRSGPLWMGIVGFDFLKFFNVTFDFPRKKLRLKSDH